MPSLLISSISCNSDSPNSVDTTCELLYDNSQVIDVDCEFEYTKGLQVVDVDCEFEYSLMTASLNCIAVNYSNDFNIVDVSVSLICEGVHYRYEGSYLPKGLSFGNLEISTIFEWYSKPPFKDNSLNSNYHHVFRFDDKPFKPDDQRYLPSLNFRFDGSLIEHASNFIEPIDYDLLKTRLSPVTAHLKTKWAKTTKKDIIKELKWGYSLNNFIIGGDVNAGYLIDDDAINIPQTPSTSSEVITFVNVVNIVTLPERTAIEFTDFSLSYDIDSISWAVNFSVPDSNTANLIKPQGTTVKELEININGEIFNVFIGRTSTSRTVSDNGSLKTSIKCSGWSLSKLLTYPYHARRSFTDVTVSTPAGILAAELTGTGFTGVWGSVSWAVPANTFTYIDKAPIAALSDMVQAVGAVIIPTPDAKEITIKPRYPVSPWNWDATTADVNLNEGDFFSMDTEWIPQESPDSIYVYGDSTNGVGVKAVRSGQPGTKTLPTVISKYMTDNVPALERGRIEIAKNGYKEIIPISTYVDPTVGIIKPPQLLNITELNSSNSWKGQVVGVAINLKRRGRAVVQTIQVEKHYAI